MRDSELAASIMDGDPGALAEAYDKYADLLWSYCRSLLNDADQSAEAVADTFVIASSRLDVLPASGRFRAWLYAVARIECQRRLRSAKGLAAPGGAERLRYAAAKLSTGEQRQLRALLSEAFAGLDAGERDVMQLVWHGLDLAEVAAVLGMTRNDAYGLFTRARDQLEASVGVLLMGWAGRGGCDEFEGMLYGRDSKLTPELRTRLSRHIARCGVCAEGYRRQMRPSLMLCLSVGALLSEAEDARAAASRAPAGLWEQVYQMTSQQSPESRWHKILGGRRLSFGPDGFPRQLTSGRDGLGTPVKVAAVGAVAVAATATGWATHGHFADRPDAGSGTPQGVAAVTPDSPAVTHAASKGAHAGKPSAKTHSRHKPAHAKPSAPARTAATGTSPSSLPVPASSAVPVSGGSSSGSSYGSTSAPSSSGATSSGATSSGSSASTSPASSGSTSSGSGGSGSSGSGSSGSSGSTPAPTSKPAPAPTTRTNPVSGLVGGVGKTVSGIVGGL